MLIQFKFSSNACNLIFSYLTGRYITVRIDDDQSRVFSVLSGVPRGSVLGPLLFSLYVNDITKEIKHSIPHQFADDLQCYIASSLDQATINISISKMNEDLNGIYEWSINNKLDLNIKKSQAIIIYDNVFDSTVVPPIMLNKITIPFINKVRNLGIIMNNLFTWDNHIGLICSKVYNMLRKLYSISAYIPRSLRKKLIVSLVLPHFLFGDIIFSNCSALCKRKLEVCFNACLRFIFKRRKYDSVSDVVNSIVGCPLFTYYKLRHSLLMFKLRLTKQPIYLYRNLQFASSDRTCNLIIPSHSSSIMSNSFIVSSAVLWNSLPNEIKSCTKLMKFKTLCKSFFEIEN